MGTAQISPALVFVYGDDPVLIMFVWGITLSLSLLLLGDDPVICWEITLAVVSSQLLADDPDDPVIIITIACECCYPHLPLAVLCRLFESQVLPRLPQMKTSVIQKWRELTESTHSSR